MTTTTTSTTQKKSFEFNGVIRRTIGFVIAIPALIGAGYAIAWNPQIGKLVEGMGGIIPLILAIAAVIITVLAFFWPKRWPEGLRKVSILVALVAAWFGRDALSAILSNGWSLLLLFGVVAGLGILWLITAYDLIGKLMKRADR